MKKFSVSKCPLTKPEYKWCWSYFKHTLRFPHDYTGNDLNDCQRRALGIFYTYYLYGDASDCDPFFPLLADRNKMDLFYRVGYNPEHSL
jgi:hypothetical protein